jgi:hypothetical protein
MRKLLGFAFALGFAALAHAQSSIETKTIELKHMKPEEAISLLKPYLVNAGGSVTGVGTMPIVTIRDVSENIAKMEKVLAKYDHSPATIRLVFQLIEADTGPKLSNASNARPVASDLDATLRSVLRFTGYRLAAQGVATSGEDALIRQRFAPADSISYFTYDISAHVGAIRLSDATLLASAQTRAISNGQVIVDTSATGSVALYVSLEKRGPNKESDNVISTSLEVPLGHTVVLGTAMSLNPGMAIILTVKPELVRAR